MSSVLRNFAAVVALTWCWSVAAEETIVRSLSLPGASLDQEVKYSTSKADYEATRDRTLERMKKGDQAAFVNPADGPWMLAETTAKIGVEWKGVGVSRGRKNVRRISAAEEALFLYQKLKNADH